MKIVIASDSYKGSCSSLEAANFIEKGVRKACEDAKIIKIPIADGGEGTVDALVKGKNGRLEEVEVIGPLDEKVLAKYGIIDKDTGVIEMAAASGLTLIDNDMLDPLRATTYGTGQLIKSAMERGLKKIYLGLGGSATNDGGIGMAQALGISFKDIHGNELGYGGGELNKLEEIDFTNIHPLLKDTEIMILSDVQNPFFGDYGASNIFGPQKGATKGMIKVLDDNLKHFAKKIKEYTGKDIIDVPGAGAAGGLGGGL